MIRLRVLSGQKAGFDHEYTAFPFSIGRAANDELRLADNGVWDRHLTIDYQPGEGWFVRKNPKASAMLNHTPLEEARLKAGDELELGSVRIQFWLIESEQRELKGRERLTWAMIALAVAAQVALAVWLA